MGQLFFVFLLTFPLVEISNVRDGRRSTDALEYSEQFLLVRRRFNRAESDTFRRL